MPRLRKSKKIATIAKKNFFFFAGSRGVIFLSDFLPQRGEKKYV